MYRRVTLSVMETLKISCPNCGHDAGILSYEPHRTRNLPPLASLPHTPILNGSDHEIFGSWVRDTNPPAGIWNKPGDLHRDFSAWWTAEGGAPLYIPGQRRMSAALIALGWVYKKAREGRRYARPVLAE